MAAQLTGKTVLLTGSSRGIGRETAQVLGEAGAHVVAHYGTGAGGAEEATADIPADRKLLVQADFREPGAALALWDEAVAWRGGIDVVVSNAAVMPEVALDDPDELWDATWAHALEVNVLQPAHLVRQAVRHFQTRGGGTIIALSSWAAQRGASNPKLTAYAASKAALAAMVKTVARAHAKDGILAYLVAPGVVRTDMSLTSASTQGGEDAVTATLAMGEWVPPREIGELIAFLATGACRHLTGATLDVNGASYVR